MIRTCIFDMDGVLADTELLYYRHNQEFFRRFDTVISPEEYERFAGISAFLMWSELKERYRLPYSVEWLMKNEKETFFTRIEALPGLEPISGIPDLLAKMKEDNIKIGLASSSPRITIDLILQKTALRRYFEVIVSGEDVISGKPAPDIFLKTARDLGEEPRSCLVIEDSHNGVTAAKAAGMACVAFRNLNSGRQNLQAATKIVDSFSPNEIASILNFFHAGL